MSDLQPLESYYQNLFYQLLPGLYRSRDKEKELQRFVAIFGHETARLRANIDQLYRDFFIDSCQEWVIPYIADLIDTNIVFNQGARNRADVKNTMKWRRQKGTLDGLEDIAAQIGGWGAHASEMFAKLIWSQNLNHIRRTSLHTVDLANGTSLSRICTPFDTANHTVHLNGAYQIPNVKFSVWSIPSQPWTGADPSIASPLQYRFHPLGRDQALYAGGDKPAVCSGADICFPKADHVPIRNRDFRDNPLSYFGVPSGFSVYEDGIPLCASASTLPSQSTLPSVDFFELAQLDGIRVADTGLFGGPSKQFRISAIRLQALSGGGSPFAVFSTRLQMDGTQGDVNTATFTYSKGLPFRPEEPHRDQPFLVIRIERTGPDADFPECEAIFLNATGGVLLAFLPAFAGFGSADQLHLYVAEDGSTYFARGSHSFGGIDLNPNSASLGAFLFRHLARGSSGQARPLPGIRPLRHRKAVYRPLCCWEHPLQRPPAPGEVAFDPELGRFAFPAGEVPAGDLTVAFRFALTGECGAGPYFRGDLPPTTITVAKADDAPHRTIQDAINAAPAGVSAIVIEILDSRTYSESLLLNRTFPGGITIRAAALQMPVIASPGGPALDVTSPSPSLTLDGLTFSGGAITITADVPDMRFRFCSIEPASSGIDIAPPAVKAKLAILNCITGGVNASANVSQIGVSDSIVQSANAIVCSHELALDHVTVLGSVQADTVHVSNSILFGSVAVANAADSCVRYSRHPKNPPAFRRFHCTSAFPIFSSLRFGHPGYARLTPNTAQAIRSGGEDGGEMGAFYLAGIPWREQNTVSKLNEYLPAGLRVMTQQVLPLSRFAGVRRT